MHYATLAGGSLPAPATHNLGVLPDDKLLQPRQAVSLVFTCRDSLPQLKLLSEVHPSSNRRPSSLGVLLLSVTTTCDHDPEDGKVAPSRRGEDI